MRNQVNGASAAAGIRGTAAIARGGRIGLMGTTALLGAVIALVPNTARAQSTTYPTTGTYSTPIVMTAPTTLTANTGVQADQSGLVTEVGSQSLTVAGPGIVTLSNAGNTWTGSTTVNSGSTMIGQTTTISGNAITDNGVLIYDQSVAGNSARAISGTGSLIKRGEGEVGLSGTLNYTGATTIEAGTLTMVGTSNGMFTTYPSLSNSSSVNLGSSAVLNDGTGTLSSSGTLNNLSGLSGSRVNFSSKGVTLANSENTTFAGVLSNGGFGTGSLTKTGTGTLTLTAANSVGGNVAINGGTLALAGAGSLANNGYTIASGAALDIAGTTATSTNASFINGAGDIRLGANSLYLTSNGTTTFSGVIGGTTTTTVNGAPVVTAATGGLTLGAGTLTLSGANDYNGTTTVNAGTSLIVTGSLSGASALVINGNLDTSNLAAGYGVFASLSGADTGRISIGGDNFIINNGSGDFAGIISSSGNAVVGVNSGTQIFSGDNTYTGATVLQGGSLTLGNGGTTGSVAGDIEILYGSDTLTMNRSDDFALANYIHGAGNFVQAGTGTTTITNASDLTGAVSITGGTLALAGGNALGDTASVNVGAAGTLSLRSDETIGALSGAGTVEVRNNYLTVSQDTDTVFSGVITGTSATPFVVGGFAPYYGYYGPNQPPVFTALEAAVDIMGGQQSDYQISTNDSTITNTAYAMSKGVGLVTVAENYSLDGGNPGYDQIGDTSAFVYDPYTSGAFGGYNYIFGTHGNGGLVKEGTGTLTLTGVNTYTGETDVYGGTLALSGSGSIAASSLVYLDGGNLDVSGVTGGSVSLKDLGGDGNVAIGANTLHITSADYYTLYGAISGSGGLSIDGGEFGIGGAQAYTGATQIGADARLNLATYQDPNVELLASSSAVNVDGQLQVNGAGTQTIHNVTGAGSIGGSSGINLTLAGTSTFDGTINVNYYNYNGTTYDHSRVTVADGTLTLNGDLYAEGGVTVAEGATLKLGDNPVDGVTGGQIRVDGADGYGITLQDSSTLQVNRSADLDFDYAITGTGNFVQSGTGTTTLSGQNGFTGTVSVTGGTLALRNGNAIADTSAVTVGAGGTLAVLNGEAIGSLSGAGSVQLTNALTLNQDVDTIFSGVISSVSTPVMVSYFGSEAGYYYGDSASRVYSPLEAAQTIYGNQYGSQDFLVSTDRYVVTNTGWATTRGDGISEVASTYSNDVGAPGYNEDGDVSALAPDAPSNYTTWLFLNQDNSALVKNGNGTLTLTGVNTYTGETDVNGGTLALSGAGSIANSSFVNLDGGNLDVSGVTGGSASLQAIGGDGNVALGANTLHLTGDGENSFNGVINGSGGLSLDAGYLELNNTQTYAGATTIGAGATLALRDPAYYDSSQTSQTGILAASSGVVLNGTLNIGQTNTQTIKSLTGANADASLYLGSATLVISNASGSFAGDINGYGSVRIDGGTQVLTGSNDYYGGTTLNGGNLTLGDGGTSGSLNASSVQINAGTLTFNRSDSVDFGNYIGNAVTTYHDEPVLDEDGNPVLDGEGVPETQQVGVTTTNTGAIVQAGTGTTTLYNAYGFNGAVSITAGTLALASNGLGDFASVDVGAAGTLKLINSEAIGSLSGSGTVSVGDSTLYLNQDTDTVFSGVITSLGPVLVGEISNYYASWYGNDAGNSPRVMSGTEVGNWYFGGNPQVSTASDHVTHTAFANSYGTGTIVEVAQDYSSDADGLGYNAPGDVSAFVYDNSAPGYTNYFFRENGNGGLTKQGIGTLTLTGVNTYLGATNIYDGTLGLSGAGSIAASDYVSVGSDATLDVSGVNGAATSIAALGGNGSVVLGGTTLTIATPYGEEFDGVISGTGGLTIAVGAPHTYTDEETGNPIVEEGNGVFSLGGANTYTGVTTINAGATLALVTSSDDGECSDCVSVDAPVLDAPAGGSIARSSLVQIDGTFDVRTATTPTVLTIAGAGSILLGSNALTINGDGGSSVFSGVISDNLYTYVGSWHASDGPAADSNPPVYSGLETAALLFGGSADDYQISTNASSINIDHEAWGVFSYPSGYAYNSRWNEDESEDEGEPGFAGDYAFSTYVNAPLYQGGGGEDRLFSALSPVPSEYANYAFLKTQSSAGGSITKEGSSALTLSGVNTYTGLTTISGGTLNVAGGNAIVDTNTVLVNAGGTFGLLANETIGTLNGAGNVALGSSTLTLGDGGDFSGVASGTGGLTIAGGTLSLSGANLYSGATTINAGTLALTGAGSLTNSQVIDNAAFDISGHTGGATIGGLAGAGTVALGANTLTLASGGTFAGVASGTGGLTIAGGSEVLTGNNTYTGTTTLSGGNLALGNGGTTGSVAGPIALTSGVLTVNHSNAVTLAAISGAGSFVQAGTGTTALTGANTYTGTTTINAGTLTLGTSGSLANSTVIDNAAFDVSGHTGGAAVGGLSGAGTVSLGANTLTLTNGGTFAGVASGTGGLMVASGSEVLTGNNTYTGATTLAGGSLTLGNGGTTGSVAGAIALATGTLTVNRSNAVTLNGVISGAGSFVQAGAGTTTLGGANTFTGTTTISAGTLALGANGSLANSAVIDNAAFDISGHTGGTTVAGLSGTGTVALGANTLTLAGGGNFAGVAAGTGGLTVTSGTVALSGANTFTGAVAVNGGTLSLGGGAALADAVAVNVASGATLALASSERIGSLAGAGSVVLGTSNLLTGGNGTSTSFAGVISGAGGLGKEGAGTFTLTASPTYTGDTQIAGGTLALGAGVRLASNLVNLSSASSVLDASATTNFNLADLLGVAGSQLKTTGLVTLGSANSTSFGGVITSTAGLTKVGTGTLGLTGANAIVGPVTVSAGTLAVSGGSAISDSSVVSVATGATFAALSSETVGNIAGSGSIILGTGAALTFGGTNAASSFANFTGTGTLNKTGTGLFTLLGANASTGLTTISAGGIQMTSGGGFAGAVSVLSGASLSGSGTTGALTLASGSTLSPGAVAGDYGTIRASSLTTAGTVRIDFGGNSTGSASDKIIVSGAIVVNGGTIDAHPTSTTRDYTFNQYFALTAGTSFTGAFTNSTSFVANEYDTRLKQRVRYDLGIGAVLEVRFLQDLTVGLPANEGGNASAVALALNGTEQDANDSFSALINALADETPAARALTLEQLSGEGSLSGQEMSSASFSSFMGVLGAHMSGGAAASASQTVGFLTGTQDRTQLGSLIMRAGSPTLDTASAAVSDGPAVRPWLQGYAIDQHLGAGNGFSATKTSGAGVAAGVDIAMDNSVFGAAISYSEPTSKVDAMLASTKAKSIGGGLYGSWSNNGWFANGTMAFASTDLDMRRSVVAGPLRFNPRGSTNALTYGSSLSVGYALMQGGTKIEPVLGLDYTHDHQKSYAETNGGAANLRYGSTDMDRLIGTAGVRVSHEVDTGTMFVTPQLRAGGAHAWGDNGIDSIATFVGAPVGTGSFRSSGASLPSSWATAGASLMIHGKESPVSVSLSYDGAFAKRLTNHIFSATVGIKW